MGMACQMAAKVCLSFALQPDNRFYRVHVAEGASRCIPSGHSRAELGKLLNVPRRAGMVRAHAVGFRSEAESESNLKIFQRAHLPIKPGERPRPQTVRPAKARPYIADAEIAQPARCRLEAVILKMKPLADAELGGLLIERLE